MTEASPGALAKLGLGTVQWGLGYGVSNRAGRTPQDEVGRILAAARRRGVTTLDTAALYGEAEAVLGRAGVDDFSVVTKTVRFDTPSVGSEQALVLEATFRRSLDLLRLDRVHALLIHQADDVLVPGGEQLVEAMLGLRERGLVSRIGVSVYDGAQVDRVLQHFVPDIVQLPISVLDQRLLASGHLARLKDAGVEIHARSIFLQGLLLMQDAVPGYFEPIMPLLTEWHARVRATGQSATQAALAFVRDLEAIDKLIVGVESLAQFEIIAEDIERGVSFDTSRLACDRVEFVNPAKWVLLK